MDKDNKFLDEEHSEMDWDAFFTGEDQLEWEKEKADRKKRRKIVVKLVSSLLVLAMLISGLAMWIDVFNLPALRFVEVSNRLSKQPEIKNYKKSVVTIEWDGVKGTGFNIEADGLIVTNEHVVEKTNRVNVHFKNGESYAGEVVVTNPDVDLAIVDIKAKNLPVLPLAPDEDWEKWEGEKIIFIGNPLSFTQIANEGRIIGKVLLKDWDVPVMMIEAPVYKGNSGSPVINQNGEVIGIIFATLEDPSIENKGIIGAAVPSYYIKKMLDELKE